MKGADGPSHDFELLSAPRVGDRISVASGRTLEEGVVDSVTWQLQAIEAHTGEVVLEGEPAGSVTLVHIVCKPAGEVVRVSFEQAEIEADRRVYEASGDAPHTSANAGRDG